MTAKLIDGIGQNDRHASSRKDLFNKQELDTLADLEHATLGAGLV